MQKKYILIKVCISRMCVNCYHFWQIFFLIDTNLSIFWHLGIFERVFLADSKFGTFFSRHSFAIKVKKLYDVSDKLLLSSVECVFAF